MKNFEAQVQRLPEWAPTDYLYHMALARACLSRTLSNDNFNYVRGRLLLALRALLY